MKDSAKHTFLFHPEKWVGDGTITFNEFGHGLKFYTQWNVSEQSEDHAKCTQEIEVEGLMDKTENKFTLSEIKNNSFVITLENESLGKVVGKGVYDDKTVAWEFSNKELGFEGFEIYELQEDGGYTTRGEYISIDQLRTIIEGKIWKKQASKAKSKEKTKSAEGAIDEHNEEGTPENPQEPPQ